jgi:predicted enzyme related to lactoylglutathione lyase
MSSIGNRPNGHFCWVDLAASDASAARGFYGDLFGWTAESKRLQGGVYSRFVLGNRGVASVYQLRERHLAHGVPSHWTPYVSVADARASAERAEALGGAVIVDPFEVAGVARIALIQDPIGASFGLWEEAAAEPNQK